MKLKHLLIYAVVAIVIASCSKSTTPGTTPTTPPTNTNPGGTVTNPSTIPYSIVENFEYGAKTAYADGNVTLATGSWDFNLALIGSLAGDAKDGNWAARLNASTSATPGSLGMNFDIQGVKTLYISHAKYSTDASAASAWQLMASTDGGNNYIQVGNTITETGTTLVVDSFKISTTGKIRFKITKTTAGRVDLDDITFKGVGDPGITVTIPPPTTIDTTGTSTSAAPRGISFGADAPPETGDNSNILFGNPSNAATISNDNLLIDQHYYVESYNATKGEPNWVSWHLDASNITNVQDRLNDFAGFSGLPAGVFQVENNGYQFSTYGFDRGHNCPSADRSSSADANSSTFLMTNMIPQAPQNNEQTWGNLENYLRGLVTAGNEVYIIMGNYGTGGVGSVGSTPINTIDGGHVNVPSNVWKVAVVLPVGDGDISRVTATTRVISVNTPNINSINSDWTKYIVTLKSIETATGFNILSALPADVHAAIDAEVDPGH